ncbi:sensor histidine kinase [Geosporobacter ferrireducens]|uniref:histidine kinase n=1 Tax=Geosporobacter ferrireducens TaxID=1424294 RepID=A0A1D8GBA7_9FIRM|nr:HAMP domain-containing sensor histidine kinase [Geosporobacter ferrireducens]AOT68194.1 two-component sensor histidine kinase [Geosporobacter ferrireducens]MTI54244.1 HAMP domain-containing histidine kinase [Geosporobacter ferrireducens]
MKSIRKRLVFYFMFIIIITVVTLEIFLINNVKQNYYKNLEDSLHNQIKVSTDLYHRYFADATLHENVLNNVDTFWKQTSAQVEIIDTDGNVLMDSIGIIPANVVGMEDVNKALQGQTGKWMGKVEYDNEKVMAVSYPLYSGEEIVGVLRFITSLKEVNKDIRKIATVFMAFGALVIVISGFVSIFLASTIVDPLQEVTAAAEKMALGDFKTKSQKRVDDEIGKLSDTLNYMASEILKKEELKNDFISSVSHELRTPLTSIKGWAVTLKQGYEDREMLTDGLEIIEKESDRLTHMVEELLDFSKFVSGKITLEKQPVDITGILEHIRKQLTPRAIRDQIDFQIVYPKGLPITYSDENRLKQVFINILDNAFKFTSPEGRIRLETSYEDGQFLFHIRDTGCGIPEEELPKIKEKFYKGKSSKSKNGIGLSICDEIIKRMNGKLEITSKLNVGTEVAIILPLQERE